MQPIEVGELDRLCDARLDLNEFTPTEFQAYSACQEQDGGDPALKAAWRTILLGIALLRQRGFKGQALREKALGCLADLRHDCTPEFYLASRR